MVWDPAWPISLRAIKLLPLIDKESLQVLNTTLPPFEGATRVFVVRGSSLTPYFQFRLFDQWLCQSQLSEHRILNHQLARRRFKF